MNVSNYKVFLNGFINSRKAGTHEAGGQNDLPQDISKYIQTEIAKCMENMMHQQSG